MKKVIEQVVKELHADFALYPFKYTSSEAEAQFRVFDLLQKKYIKGNIIISRGGKGRPVPPIENEASPRIKLEWKFKDRINDIVIFKEGISDPDSYEDDVESVIEIKSTWGAYRHLDTKGFLKDLKFVHDHPEIGFFLVFIANKFNELSKTWQEYYENKFEALKTSKEYSFKLGQVFLIFRDIILR